MEKTYQKPMVKVVEGDCEEILAASGVTDSGNGIGYGGIDAGGSKDPNAKENVWGADDTTETVWDK